MLDRSRRGSMGCVTVRQASTVLVIGVVVVSCTGSSDDPVPTPTPTTEDATGARSRLRYVVTPKGMDLMPADGIHAVGRSIPRRPGGPRHRHPPPKLRRASRRPGPMRTRPSHRCGGHRGRAWPGLPDEGRSLSRRTLNARVPDTCSRSGRRAATGATRHRSLVRRALCLYGSRISAHLSSMGQP
jgi:hypothetical protein